MLIRILSLPPPGELDEFDLSRYRAGVVYEVPPQLATILIIGGHAEPVSSVIRRDTAAEWSPPPKKPSKPEPV